LKNLRQIYQGFGPGENKGLNAWVQSRTKETAVPAGRFRLLAYLLTASASTVMAQLKLGYQRRKWSTATSKTLAV
jgi:hypothetical protein